MLRRTAVLVALLTIAVPQSLLAWNATGHELVARIAWENMTPSARQNAVALLQLAPMDACLLDLFATDSRPLDVRQREFFVLASTWADIIRPEKNDQRPCIRFHRRDWHFADTFWAGFSGATGTDRPTDRKDIKTPEVNLVERLKLLRPLSVCSTPPCGTLPDERAIAAAWILHLIGDVHQPLHVGSHVTTRPDEKLGDQGGNLFKLQTTAMPLSLHSYWDGIIDRGLPRQPSENHGAFVERVAGLIMSQHSRVSMAGRIDSGDADGWSKEGFQTNKANVYPRALKRGVLPNATYQARALSISIEAIALGGYRLADLLNAMFG